MIQHTAVASSNIASIGYDDDTSTLEVQFTSGGRYQYSDVPREEFDAFVAALSKGAYFADNIKYTYQYSRN